jgi:hypothetical protein
MAHDYGTSALVVLRPESGRLAGGEAITAETVAEYQPDAETARAVMGFFRSAGFDVGPLVGLGFAISGSTALFERTFGRSEPNEGESNLPLSRVPEPLRDHVQAVAFTRPPDFGPTKW